MKASRGNDRDRGAMMETNSSPAFAFIIFTVWLAGFVTILVRHG